MLDESRRFGNRLCFLLQARKTPILVYPLDRTTLNQCAQ